MLQSQGADLVIALTHMRVPNDEKLAKGVAEIDAVLGGHDHHVQVSCHILSHLAEVDWMYVKCAMQNVVIDYKQDMIIFLMANGNVALSLGNLQKHSIMISG